MWRRSISKSNPNQEPCRCTVGRSQIVDLRQINGAPSASGCWSDAVTVQQLSSMESMVPKRIVPAPSADAAVMSPRRRAGRAARDSEANVEGANAVACARCGSQPSVRSEGVDSEVILRRPAGVYLSHDADPAVGRRSASFELRQREAGARHERYYREYAGADGYRPGETKTAFLAASRRGAGPRGSR